MTRDGQRVTGLQKRQTQLDYSWCGLVASDSGVRSWTAAGDYDISRPHHPLDLVADWPAEADDLDGWKIGRRRDMPATAEWLDLGGTGVGYLDGIVAWREPRKPVRETQRISYLGGHGTIVYEVEDGKPVPGSLRWEGE